MTRMSLAKRALWRARRLILTRGDGAGTAGPLVVAGFFRTASGVGQSARACVAGLRRHGVDPLCVDVSAAFGQVDLDPGLALAPMPRGAGGVLILHANAPETERALFELGLWRGRGWRVIGYWAWELDVAPPGWAAAARHLAEVWTPSAFVAGAFRESVSRPVKVVPHYVEVPPPPPPPRGGATVCLAMADGRSSFHRKNLLGAVAAFRRAAAARDDVRLIVKTRNLREYPEDAAALAAATGGDPRIETLDRSLPASEQKALIAAADIVVSLHRSEGFGLVLAEAMAAGKAVVATAWSGNMDFTDADVAMMVPARRVAADDPSGVYAQGGGRWAEPDLDAAAAMLSRLFDDPGLRERLGRKARERVRARLDGGAYMRALEGG